MLLGITLAVRHFPVPVRFSVAVLQTSQFGTMIIGVLTSHMDRCHSQPWVWYIKSNRRLH